MPFVRPVVLAAALLLSAVATAAAQAPPPNFREEFLRQFDWSMSRFVRLAEAMPAERFAWSPGEGVMPVARVYAHVTRYNYYYPSCCLEVAAPEGRDGAATEEVAEKDAVVALLRASGEHVRSTLAAMSDEELAAPTVLYRREVPRWSVLLQLLAHMNEHLGQSIAYARMNGVVPPWSQ